MAYAHLNPFAAAVWGGIAGPDVQCFGGVCSQDRKDIAAVPASMATEPDLVVTDPTRFLTIATDGKLKVYAGDPNLSATDKGKRAFVMTDFIAVGGLKAGDVVHVWLA